MASRPRCGGERVDEQPLRRGADEREQRPERAGERRDRVVGAEEPGRVVSLGRRGGASPARAR